MDDLNTVGFLDGVIKHFGCRFTSMKSNFLYDQLFPKFLTSGQRIWTSNEHCMSVQFSFSLWAFSLERSCNH